MRVWRITRRPFQALDGEGARLNGGRWNSEGVAVVYTSFALSLAALEYLVHVDVEEAPADLVALEIDVPDDVPADEVRLDDLPEDWNRVEDHPACASIGDRWVRDGRALVLRAPSAVIPHESNYLLNPKHPDAARIRVVSVRDFVFDPRLLE
ncbi:MAG TPA: RES family NAD+ phosphorylase [Longimicrobium sp.]|jgi:RES domain-containing protein